MLRGDNSERYGWLIGGGIPSLAAAAYMIREAKMDGRNIYIFENAKRILDRSNPEEKDRIWKEELPDYQEYALFMDLLSDIPSVATPDISAKEELINFNKKIVSTDASHNQYNIVLLSLRSWLKKRGVVFNTDGTVKKLGWIKYADTNQRAVNSITWAEKGKSEKKEIGLEDVILITNDYITEKISGEYHNLVIIRPPQTEKITSVIEAEIKKVKQVLDDLLGLNE